MKCTMKKIAGIIVLTAILSTAAIPVFAAESATGGINVTYKANSATTDKADWLVSYPKTVTVSDYNDSIANGVSLDFKLFNKNSSDTGTTPYTGTRTVAVTIDQYAENGINMTGGTGTAALGMAAGGTELTSSNKKIADLKQTSASGAATAFLKNTNNAEGTFNANVGFTFTDDSI